MKLDRSLLLIATICVAIYAARQAVVRGTIPAQPAEVVAAAQRILDKHCYQCHGPSKQEGDLRLDLAEAALKGGEGGAVITPGHADKSLLIKYVSGTGDKVMPQDGPRLNADEVATLKTWIDAGAKWPGVSTPAAADPRLSHWSFQPVH